MSAHVRAIIAEMLFCVVFGTMRPIDIFVVMKEDVGRLPDGGAQPSGMGGTGESDKNGRKFLSLRSCLIHFFKQVLCCWLLFYYDAVCSFACSARMHTCVSKKLTKIKITLDYAPF